MAAACPEGLQDWVHIPVGSALAADNDSPQPLGIAEVGILVQD